jgi:uncharacterized protein (TIGR00290 family)
VAAGIVPMDSKKKITIGWSGGKDSALALFKIIQSSEYDVVGLHTVINEETRRVGMHGVREELIAKQAESIGLPLTKLYLESSESHSAYERLMKKFYQHCVERDICGVVFGDIFLEDLRKFREELLQRFGLKGIFPLWKLDTNRLMNEFLSAGFKTLLCAADAKHFSSAQTGKTLDEDFIRSLPINVDVCGENGEFHTFVYDGPIFKEPVPFEYGGVVKKSYSFQKRNGSKIQTEEIGFWFQDLRPRITS